MFTWTCVAGHPTVFFRKCIIIMCFIAISFTLPPNAVLRIICAAWIRARSGWARTAWARSAAWWVEIMIIASPGEVTGRPINKLPYHSLSLPIYGVTDRHSQAFFSLSESATRPIQSIGCNDCLMSVCLFIHVCPLGVTFYGRKMNTYIQRGYLPE